MSVVSWFHRFRGVSVFMVLQVLWCQWFHGFLLSVVSWFPRFRGFNGGIVSCVCGFIGFVMSMVSCFHRSRGVNGFMVS